MKVLFSQWFSHDENAEIKKVKCKRVIGEFAQCKNSHERKMRNINKIRVLILCGSIHLRFACGRSGIRLLGRTKQKSRSFVLFFFSTQSKTQTICHARDWFWWLGEFFNDSWVFSPIKCKIKYRTIIHRLKRLFPQRIVNLPENNTCGEFFSQGY